MKLLTAELRARLPALYAQEKIEDPVVHIKFFTPDSNWTWYATEGQAEEDDFRVLGRVHLTYMNGVHPDALPDRTAWEFRFILSMGTPDIDTDDDD